MIDPVTALSVAVNAFGTVKRMVAAGKEVEDATLDRTCDPTKD